MKRILTLLLLCAAINLNAQVAFTPGNLVALRVSNAASANTGAVALLEITPTGTIVQTISVASTLPGSRLVVTGNGSTEAGLTLSADGKYITFGGYDTTSNITTNTSARVVARVGSNGVIDYTTKIPFADMNNAIRQSATNDGSGFWVTSGTKGVRYVPYGNPSTTNSVVMNAVPANNKAVNIFNSQLYTLPYNTSGTHISSVGTGLPTTTSQTITQFTGLTTASNTSFQGFYMADLNATEPGLDVLYTIQTSGTVISKFSKVGGTWAANGTIGITTGGYGMTGNVSGGSVNLYVTTGSNTSQNTLQSLTDIGGYNAAINGTLNTIPLSTALTTNTVIRGIAFVPTEGVTWTGAISTVWNDGGNWVGGVVPTATALIPSVASGSNRYPVLPTSLTIAALNIGDGATVSIDAATAITGDLSVANGGILNINANTTVSGNLSVTSSATLAIAAATSLTVTGNTTGGGPITGSGKVIMTGAAKTFGCSFNNVDLNGGTVNLSGTITVSGILNGNTGSIAGGNTNTLTLGASASAVFSPTFSITLGGASTTINFNNRPVTFQSSAAGTFRFGQIIGTLSNATNVTVERYIPSNLRRKYTMVGSPVTSSIHAGWQEGGATVTGYGTHITKAGGGVDGSINTGSFDAGVAATGASIFTYNDDNGTGAKWVAITDTKEAATLAPGKGYLLFVRGDRSTNRTTGAVGIASSSNTVLRATGILGATGTQTGATTAISLTSLLKTAASKYSLVANPLTNILDWNLLKVDGTNFVNLGTSFTVYDPNLGVFVSSDGITVTPSGSQQHIKNIQPGQAFFVQNNASGIAPTLNILESHKSTSGATASTSTVFGEEQPVANEFAQLNINVFKAADNSFADGAVAIFGNAFNTAVDAKEDIKKFTNFNESFSIRRGNTALGLEARPVLANDTLLFNLGNFGKKDYNFVIDGSNFKNAVATLEDKYTATKQPIDVTGITNYKFTVNSDAASVANDRFMITFGNTLPIVPIADAPASLFVKMSPNPVSGQLMVSFKNAVANETMINVVNSLGQIVKTVNAGNVSTGNVNVPVSELASGIYNVQLISGGKIITTQQVVKAQN